MNGNGNGNGKCESHDDCFRRLFDKIEEIDKKQEDRNEKLCDLLHTGDIRFTQLEMRIAQIESKVRSFGGINWQNRWVTLCFNLLQNGILIVLAMAWWASQNGWGQ